MDLTSIVDQFVAALLEFIQTFVTDLVNQLLSGLF